jgi:hypothetical protein
MLRPSTEPRAGWAAAFSDTSLTAEDREWLDAPLASEDA